MTERAFNTAFTTILSQQKEWEKWEKIEGLSERDKQSLRNYLQADGTDAKVAVIEDHLHSEYPKDHTNQNS